MIKNLLNADEEPPAGVQVTIEDRLVNPSPVETTVQNESETAAPEMNQREGFEIPEGAKFFNSSEETELMSESQQESAPSGVRLRRDDYIEDDNLLEVAPPENFASQPQEIEKRPFENSPLDQENEEGINLGTNYSTSETAAKIPHFTEISHEPRASEMSDATTETVPELPIVKNKYTPETPDETIRKSGLAYSAAIVLLVSIVFMMILGWFADLLFGSSPFGIVGGIILGAIVGFIQFFRITSSILK